MSHHAFIDESFRRGTYIVCAATVAPPDLGTTRTATGGIVAAVCTVAAAIYAQVRNLWQYAPTWVRVAVWGLIAWSVLATLWTRSAA